MNWLFSYQKLFNSLFYFRFKRKINISLKCRMSSFTSNQSVLNKFNNNSNQTDCDINNYISITSDILKVNEKECKFLFSILQLKQKYFHSKMLTNRFFCEYLLIIDLLNTHFTPSQIINCPELLLCTYSSLQTKLKSLHSFGFKNLKPIHIIYYSTFITYSESKLKEIFILDKNVNVLESLLSKYSLSSEDKIKIEKVIGDGKTNLPIGCLKKKVLSIIQCHINKRLPLKNCEENNTKDLNEFYFLSQRCKDYLKEIPSFKKLKAPLLIACFPNLMKLILPEQLGENLFFLVQQLKFTEEQLLAGVRAVSLPKSLIINRLDILIGTFGNKILSHQSVLGFVSQVNFFSSIEKLKKIDIFKIDKSFPRLIRTKEKKMLFSAFIFYKISFHIKPSTSAFEINKLKKKITERLNEHPFCNEINFKNSNQVLDYLLNNKNFSPIQIANASCIVMYDISSIESALNEIETQLNYLNWVHDQYFLQLVLYYLEKRNSFKGEVVFANLQLKDNKN